jgi:uncharacterized protein (TIGR00369 family)
MPPPATPPLTPEVPVHQRPSPPDTAVEPDLTSTGRTTRERTYCWEDPAIAAAAEREQDGASFLQAVLDGTLPGVPIAHTLDFRPASVQPGVVAFEFTPAEFHYNPIGSVHGGMIATLCDSACACAVHSMLPAGTHYASLDLSVKFLRPVTAATGPMTCTGTVTHLGGRSALAQASLTDAGGKLYAHATSSCMIFRPAAATPILG